jgi:hypothetical protein
VIYLAAIVTALAYVSTVAMFLRADQAKDARYAAERRELLTRIQHPERIPVDAAPPQDLPDREPDGWGDVGSVRITDEWLKAED